MLFKGVVKVVLSRERCRRPENWYPGNMKSWMLSFLVAAVEATANLRGPRIEIWASPG